MLNSIKNTCCPSLTDYLDESDESVIREIVGNKHFA